MNKSLIAIKHDPTLDAFSDMAIAKAASLNLEKEMKTIKQYCQNPEKVVDDFSKTTTGIIVDPNAIVMKLESAAEEIVN